IELIEGRAVLDGPGAVSYSGTLQIGSVRAIPLSGDVSLPYPSVEDDVNAHAASNDNALLPSEFLKGTELRVKKGKVLTVAAGNYYFTRMDVKGRIDVAAPANFYLRGRLNFGKDAEVTGAGKVVQAACLGSKEDEDDADEEGEEEDEETPQTKIQGKSISASFLGPDVRARVCCGTKFTGSMVARDIRIGGHALLTGTLFAKRDLRVEGKAVVQGNVTSLGSIRVRGDALVSGNATAGGSIQVEGKGKITGARTTKVPFAFTVSATWDGRTGSGQVAPEGTYAAKLSTLSILRQGTTLGTLSTPTVLTVTVDLTSPVVTSRTPEGAAEGFQPTIAANYSDALSGIDVASVSLLLDGVPVSATASSTGVTFAPIQPLSSGMHTVVLVVSDRAANGAVSSWTFSLDQTPPSITVMPADGSSTTERKPTLSASYFDPMPGSGIDTASFHATLDGVAASFAVGPNAASCAPGEPLADGPHVLTVTIADRGGNATTAHATFHVVTALAPVGTTGGSLAVADPTSPIYGAGIVIPEGALPGTAVFTIESVPAPPTFPAGFTSSGFVVDFNPTTTFSTAVTVAIPYNPALIPAGIPPTALKLLKYDLALSTWVLVPILSIDTVNHLVYAEVTKLIGVMFGVAGQEANADQSSVSLDPAKVPGDGVSFSAILVTPRDIEGRLLGPNQNVTVVLLGAGDVSPVLDLGNGVYQAFATSDTTGTVAVKATVNGVVLSSQPAITFLVAYPDYFALENLTSPLEAGYTTGVTITAKLNSGDVFTGFAGTVEIHLTGTRDGWGTQIFPEVLFAALTSEHQGTLTIPNAILFARAGVQTVRVFLVTRPTVSGFAQVVVTRGPATYLDRVAGNGQVGKTGTVLPQPLVARVADGFGNPVPGVSVNFEAGEGGALFTSGGGGSTGQDLIVRLAGGFGDGTATAAPL
ncbi:MAG: polymer-forming cytoskeletal protein, partial [Deltaproteobacteria bacterium]|nr:polymer-forming cytoskeletal protein [Deltaproteobacteria bacterium]